LVDGIICFNAIVTNETKKAEINMANKKWRIFTWAGTEDVKFNYSKVAIMY
jgi:hypothetical protein